MHRLALFTCVVISALVLPAASPAQNSNDNAAIRMIQGVVRASGTQQELEGARVDLQTPDLQLITSTFSDSNGKFEFRNLVRGIYRVQMSAAGYETLAVSVDLRFSYNAMVDNSLKPIVEPVASKTETAVSVHELSMPERARDAMEAGMEKLYKKKDAQGSLADFAVAITEAPNYYEAYYHRGVANWQLNKSAEAEQDLRKCLALSEDKFTQANLALGALFLDRKQFAEAEKPFRRALELEPTSWLAEYELARALLGEKKADEALIFASQARAANPTSPRVYLLLANIHSAQNDQAALLDDLNNYLTYDSTSPTALRMQKMKEEIERTLGKGQAASTPPQPRKP
jgi:Tfp pilus assembly protein PilF